LLVMVSAYAILTIAANTFGIDLKEDPSTRFEDAITPSGTAPGAVLPGEPSSIDLVEPPVAPQEVDPSREYTTAELQAMIIADYEENTNIREGFYMSNVRAMTTDIPGVDRKQIIDEAYYFKHISKETRDILLLNLE